MMCLGMARVYSNEKKSMRALKAFVHVEIY